MRFLAAEREVLDRLLPGFDVRLGSVPFEKPESDDGQLIEQFRQAGGGNLMLATRFGGLGADLVTAFRFQRAIGSRAPSLAVATTMHHYKILMLERFMPGAGRDELLRQIGRDRMLVASCSGEGRAGANLFRPSVTAEDTDGGLLVSGSKKPCCLTWSAGLLSVFLTSHPTSRYKGNQLNVLIPAGSPGVARYPFWKNPVLAGTQSDEIRLDAVYVPDDYIIEVGPPGDVGEVMTDTMANFEIMACGAYLGIASGLVERVLMNSAGDYSDRAWMLEELELATAALEQVAHLVAGGSRQQDTLARSLLVRYGTERVIARVTDTAHRLLGGATFISNPEISAATIGSRVLAFHPPSEVSMRERMVRYMEGEAFTLP